MCDILEVVKKPAEEVTLSIDDQFVAKVTTVQELINILATHTFGTGLESEPKIIGLQWAWTTKEVAVTCRVHRRHFKVIDPELSDSLEVILGVYSATWRVKEGQRNYRLDPAPEISNTLVILRLDDDDPTVLHGLFDVLAASNLQLSSIG
jgi:hypothetical protein